MNLKSKKYLMPAFTNVPYKPRWSLYGNACMATWLKLEGHVTQFEFFPLYTTLQSNFGSKILLPKLIYLKKYEILQSNLNFWVRGNM